MSIIKNKNKTLVKFSSTLQEQIDKATRRIKKDYKRSKKRSDSSDEESISSDDDTDTTTFEKIPGNKNVLVIGASGAGKSTTLSILHNDDPNSQKFKASNHNFGRTKVPKTEYS